MVATLATSLPRTIGQYQIHEPIGRGGMAVVYRAHHPGLGIDVAVKTISTHFANDPSFLARFRLEARAVARLRHPNILHVYDFGEEGGVAYLVSQFVAGGSLLDKLGAPLPVTYVLQIATQVASALDYAHSHGIVHRDIKPGNILLTEDGTPILADFGLAKMLERESHLTDAGTLLGSPEYIAPEQVQGKAVDAPTDVYAFGVVVYEMLTGALPFACDSPVATILAHTSQPVPSPRAKNPKLSEQVERVLLKALAKEPSERYQKVGQFVHALKVAAITLRSEPIPVRTLRLTGAPAPAPAGGRAVPDERAEREASVVLRTVEMLAERNRRVAQLEQERAGLYERVGFLEARVRELERELERRPWPPTPAGAGRTEPPRPARPTFWNWLRGRGRRAPAT